MKTMIPPKELFEFEKFKEMTTKKYGTLRGGYVRDDGHMYYTYDSGELKVGSDFMYANGDVWHGKGSNPSMKFWEMEFIPAEPKFYVRFLLDGCNVRLETGEVLPKGINIIHQYHYHLTKAEVLQAISQFKSLNGKTLKPVFAKG